jgi:hypothetical protein
VVFDGENGLLADVDDIDGLVAAVRRVHDDGERETVCGARDGRPQRHTDERLDAR